MRHTASLLALVCFAPALMHGQAAKPPTKAPAVEKKRFLHLVRYGEAKSLATTLTQHFADEPGLQIVPEATANALLITVPNSLSDELVKLLDQLDRRPRQILIDVLIAEVPLEEKENGFDPADFNGPSDTVFIKVETLARKAKLNHLRRFQIAALENQRSSTQISESKPFVTGSVVRGGGGGGATNTITYREVGTILSATPRVGADGVITVDLQVEESRIHQPENGVELGNGIVATEIVKTTLNGKVAVASGKTVLAEGVKTEAKKLKVQSIVVVAAKVIEK